MSQLRVSNILKRFSIVFTSLAILKLYFKIFIKSRLPNRVNNVTIKKCTTLSPTCKAEKAPEKNA